MICKFEIQSQDLNVTEHYPFRTRMTKCRQNIKLFGNKLNDIIQKTFTKFILKKKKNNSRSKGEINNQFDSQLVA